MKLALVHDWLNTRVGGSEQVLMELANLYPEAPIYTLLFRQQYYKGLIDPSRVRTSRLQRLPRMLTDRPRYLLPLIPTAIEQFDFSQFDVVISSSNAFSKGIITGPNTRHICYCYSPMRFAWDYWPRYLDEQKLGPIRNYFARRTISKVRLWDYYSAQRVDDWVAISDHVAERISKFYGAKARVINPPVTIEGLVPSPKRQDYYVTLATLTPYKQLDRAIQACNQLKRRLIVVGEGFQRAELETMAGPTVSFAGRVSDTEKANLLGEAKGLLVPQEEDFGIAMVEALASGTPVIAYGRGGASEIVKSGLGVLYDDDSVEGLKNAIRQRERRSFDATTLHKASLKYTSNHFAAAITKLVGESEQVHD